MMNKSVDEFVALNFAAVSLILDWIFRFRYAFREILIQLNRGEVEWVVNVLFDFGFIEEVITVAGRRKKNEDKPRAVIFLTDLGDKTIRSIYDYRYLYLREPTGTPEKLFRHSFYIQLQTLQALNSGYIVAFNTEKDLAKISLPGVKKHDAIWITKYNHRIAVEVELTSKESELTAEVTDPKTLNYFVSTCVVALETVVVGQAIDGIFIFSDDEDLLKIYQAAFKPKAAYSLTQKVRSVYKEISQYQIPQSLAGRVMCVKI